MNFFLCILSLLFGAAVWTRKWLYRLGIKKSTHFPVRTIGIGNIVAGGTGKTPLTIWLAGELAKSAQVGVALRSYKATAKEAKLLCKESDWRVVGDEACIVARRVPQVRVAVAKKKVDAARLLVEAGCDTLIIDDSLQHLKIRCDTQIVILDADNPFGYGYLLPRGLLREPLSALKRADLIVINCREALRDTSSIEEEVRKVTCAPITKAFTQVEGLFDLEDKPVHLEVERKVALFCGIAKPESFVRMVEKLGFEVACTHFVGDHEAVSKEALQRLAEPGYPLICTEKDRVKLSHEEIHFPVYWLKISFFTDLPLASNS